MYCYQCKQCNKKWYSAAELEYLFTGKICEKCGGELLISDAGELLTQETNKTKLFRKKPIAVNAQQWFQNGDHSEDGDSRFEGKVVRYFRRPDVSGDSLCGVCSKPFHAHGWIDTLESGHRVCPGDWIITGVTGERYPCKPDIFEQTYEEI